MDATRIASDAAGRGSLGSYATGFVLALVLTAVPFWMAMSGNVPRPEAVVGVLAIALVQVAVHLVFFLHLNRSSGQRWNVMAFLFAALVVAFLVGGSVWIMYHLNHNMMPMPATMG